MRILVLGATGLIGTAITTELLESGHTVTGLYRCESTEAGLRASGATPLRGDLRAPEKWAKSIADHDGIIHAAATFCADMGEVDRRVVEALEREATQLNRQLRFVYTGGCWLYGETGDEVATEAHPFEPLPTFSWMVENSARLLESSAFSVAIIHPALAYNAEGGAFARFLESARRKQPIEIWGSPDIRWPIVHTNDLAVAYRLLLERTDLSGHFNVAAQSGVRVGDIAAQIAGEAGVIVKSASEVIAEYGVGAMGPMLDQQMSAAKIRRACGWIPRHEGNEITGSVSAA